MRRILWFMTVFMSIGFIIILSACSNNKQQQKQYYYYPKANVYYDVQRSRYFYSINGGQSWDSVARLSDKDPATLGNKEIIYSTSPQVYKENEAHRKKYSGSLFSIANIEGSVNEVDTVASERARKATSHKMSVKRTSEKDKPAKKPLKDFFRKIFGKRKDR
jgi:hypothetical protein